LEHCQLSDIKAKSIVEWIANDHVRRSIVEHFHQFLMTNMALRSMASVSAILVKARPISPERLSA